MKTTVTAECVRLVRAADERDTRRKLLAYSDWGEM